MNNYIIKDPKRGAHYFHKPSKLSDKLIGQQTATTNQPFTTIAIITPQIKKKPIRKPKNPTFVPRFTSES